MQSNDDGRTITWFVHYFSNVNLRKKISWVKIICKQKKKCYNLPNIKNVYFPNFFFKFSLNYFFYLVVKKISVKKRKKKRRRKIKKYLFKNREIEDREKERGREKDGQRETACAFYWENGGEGKGEINEVGICCGGKERVKRGRSRRPSRGASADLMHAHRLTHTIFTCVRDENGYSLSLSLYTLSSMYIIIYMYSKRQCPFCL